MSVANAFIGTTETILFLKNARPRAGHFFRFNTIAASDRGAAGGRVVDAAYARAVRNGAGGTKLTRPTRTAEAR